MKKIFPVIVVLIALSLLGIIVMQISWLSNLLVVQQEKFLFRVDKAAYSVTQELGKQASSGPLMRLQRRPGLRLMPEDFSYNLIKPPTISQRYTDYEIAEKLRNSFENEGLHHLRFEFAITSNGDEWQVEMQSKNFLTADSNHYRRRVIPITPEGGQEMGGIPAYEHLFIVIPDFKTQVWQSLIWMLLGSALFTIVVIAAFYLTVKTMLNQRKLNKIKTDFINNMTHELKTPLATISLAVDALRNNKVQEDQEKRQYFSGIIKEENKRMNKHVETILQAALMEKQELKLNFKPLHIHEIINKVLDNFSLQFTDRDASFSLLLNARNDLVLADEVHFTNLINNLVDNAVKYSKEKLHITVTTHSTQKHLVIQIQDNGIGMSKETVKRIFEKFYRAHTGNLHNVKGFGLGMSYVKSVIEEHKGKIKVDSILGKGSTFTIEVPLAERKG